MAEDRQPTRPRRLSAILQADLTGYARLMQGGEDRTVSHLKSVRAEVWQSAVDAAGGRIVNIVADSVLAEFGSAAAAVAAAIDVQERMARFNEALDEEQRLMFRIGLHLGEVIVDETETIFGDAVNVAARIQLMAEPGGIAASPAIRDATHLQASCAFVDGGRHHAKNIRNSLHIYHVLPRESASRRPVRAASRMRRADIAIRRPMLWGTVAATALLLAGSGYLAFSPNPAPSVSTAAQSLSAEQLEQALAERRTADALAAEKRRLERQAQQRAEAETEAKRQADLELASARQARQKAERELAQLKADIDARRNAKDAGGDQAAAMAERATEQAAQRSAEAEAAALLQAEEQAARKAAADAEAKRRADHALAVATERRKQAETEALAAANKTAAGMAKPNEEAEAAEQRLHLEPADRRRLQVALTSLGFDTRGHDGVFGPRSREMIARWQKARNLPATGFLTRAQQALLQETEATRASYDEQKKPAASHISSAADATWAAFPTLENPACAAGIGGAQRPADWQVDIKGNTLTYASRSTKSSFTVDLKALQPDGSGRVVGKDDKNREFYVTFAPGSGARPFREASSITPCRYVYTPKT
jgi:class 3 adenylate cyclase/peptidoglycan hydrolase-like protein with peptidoglycan-binding domain